MRPIGYTRATSTNDAVAALGRAGASARFIAGGTTLYDLMKLDVETPAHLIDVTGIGGLDRIQTGGDALRFGALAAMSDVAADPIVQRDYPVLAESLWKAASQQLRNMATVGGNLLQRTRCPYFRHGAHGLYPCNKREPGTGCAAIEGLDRGQAVLGTSDSCTAVSPGDWPVALVALDAQIEVLGPHGERSVPIADLYRLPGVTPHLEFSLAPAEMITAITVPKTTVGKLSTYHKIRDRESYAFALVSAAVALDMDGRRMRAARVALGGVATVPWRATAAEQVLAGQELTDEAALAAGRTAFADAAPGHAWRTWHFLFHSLPDLPETLISGRERQYLDWFLRRKTANPETFSDGDIAEYLRVFTKDGGLRAGLAYYRAAALSAQQNHELAARGKLSLPVLAMGADQGSIADMAAPLRSYAEDVRGCVMANCGHFIPEEQPEASALELAAFFGEL